MRKVFIGKYTFALKTPPPVPLPFQGRGNAQICAKSLKIVLSAHFRLEFVFTIGFSVFVPPSLKGKGDRGKGSVAK